MKQKLMLLMVLVAGLAACTKDDAEAATDDITLQKLVLGSYGEFEGVWVVDQQEIDTAKLTVTKDYLQVRYPVEYLVKKAYKNEVEYKSSWADYKSLYRHSGSAEYMFYYHFEIDPMPPSPYGKDMAEDINPVYLASVQPFSFQSSEGGEAIFDITNHLWTLKVSIDRAIQVMADGAVRHNNITPITLVYIAKKKI